MTTPDPLAVLLAEHGENYPAGCDCGQTVGIASGDALEHSEKHRTHVATVIRAHLLSGVAVERAGRVLWSASFGPGFSGDLIEQGWRSSSAVREAWCSRALEAIEAAVGGELKR